MDNEGSGAGPQAGGPQSRSRWISTGLETLIRELSTDCGPQPDPRRPDVVIVGSGYGGAIAAAYLAGCCDRQTRQPLKVCVLERGREYIAGMFPKSEAELPGHVRFNTPNALESRGRKDALLDLRIGMDVSTLVANGLGGGSLINAGVMLQPSGSVLASDRWPAELRKPNVLQDYFEQAERQLSANGKKFECHPRKDEELLPKLKALKAFAGKDHPFDTVPLSIALTEGRNHAAVNLQKCLQCGDCMTGCNHRAKNSLDQNCLARAQHLGARLVTGATVLKVERQSEGDGWTLHVAHTEPSLQGQHGKPFLLHTRYVILAAGTFGSTEILLRSQSPRLQFSPQLGQRFSSNGDMLAAAYGQNTPVKAVARETDAFGARNIGSTITGMIDLRTPKDPGAPEIAIQEFAVPGALRRLFSEIVTLANVFHSLAQPDDSRPTASGPDPAAVDETKITNTQIFGLMGRDSAVGVLELVPGSEAGQGAIRVRWNELSNGRDASVFDQQLSTLRALGRDSGQGGTIIPNPMWRLLPEDVEAMVSIPRGPVMTVHPLGGCCMGDDWHSGVVDHAGRVFDVARASDRHDGLVVLDGSIVPCALGINPALTISALTLRALDQLCADWSLCKLQPRTLTARTPPLFDLDIKPAETIPAQVAILERLSGDMQLDLPGCRHEELRVELTLQFKPKELCELAQLGREIHVQQEQSRIRVFKKACWGELQRTGATETRHDELALFSAPLSGSLVVLERQWTSPRWRTLRTLWAWLFNRGARDAWQHLVARWRGDDVPALPGWGVLSRFANRQGTTRCFQYRLRIENADPFERGDASPLQDELRTELKRLAEKSIRGYKRVRYGLGANPWRQLTEVHLTEFPGMSGWRPTPVLRLDPSYYARQGKHLLQLTSQRDHATALFELGSLLFSFARVLLTSHLWSFRKPDAVTQRLPQRLPGPLPGIPAPSIHELEVDRRSTGDPVRIRLTRYQGPDAPVVMIHGFSANGTTFAHPALGMSLAAFMQKRGHDVWILDLRTSSGMPTCHEAWTFEDVARQDIVSALDFIHDRTGKPIDVIAHCMGAAMFSMALLDAGVGDRVRARLRRVVLSQIGPMMAFVSENVFRAYVISYIEHAVGNVNFELRPADGLGSHLLDRLLSTLPYEPEEFRLENPRTPWKRTPFVATRHRLDAWFGGVFKLKNVAPGVLDHIDDMFGDMNFTTGFQTLHFARTGVITTRRGRNVFVHRQNMQRWSELPTLSIHGDKNRLADVATLTRMHALMRSVNPQYYSFTAEGFGHQDCIIGSEAAKKIFPAIQSFLSVPDPSNFTPQTTPPATGCCRAAPAAIPLPVVQIPWLGPIRGTTTRNAVAVAADPVLGKPVTIVLVPVQEQDGRYAIADHAPEPLPRISPRLCATSVNADIEDGIAFYDVPVTPSESPLLVLLAYNNTPALDQGTFEDPLVVGTAGISPASLRQAVEHYLRCMPKEEIEPALLQLPAVAATPESAVLTPVSFALGSCNYPAGPLDPQLADASYKLLNGLLKGPTTTRPQFLVLTGDQIYTDATAGLMDATRSDDRYQRPYEAFLRTPDVRSVFARIPVYTMLDDHEIIDNWQPADTRVDVNQAKAMYLKFQRAAGPPQVAPVGDSKCPLWYHTAIEGIPFFFADTRTERQPRNAAALDAAQIMSEDQLLSLKHWLSEHREAKTPIFVVSPSMLLPRRALTAHEAAGALHSDAWDGFPPHLHALLAHIVEADVRNVTFLSGDEHHSCVATVRLARLNDDSRRKPIMIQSIHSSGLYSPYVFANGRQEELEGVDDFEFEGHDTHGVLRRYSCSVRTEFQQAGDGFCLIHCDPAQQPQVGCKFYSTTQARPRERPDLLASVRTQC